MKDKLKAHFSGATKHDYVRFAIEAAVFAVLVAADLISKKYISEFLISRGGTAPFLRGFISLYYTENTGASFGIFSDSTSALITFTLIAMICVFGYLVYAWRENGFLRLTLVAILAGGIGNLVDRIALGYVRDFFNFEFMRFGIFNVADACISVGAVFLVIYLLIGIVKESKKLPKKPKDQPKDEPEDE